VTLNNISIHFGYIFLVHLSNWQSKFNWRDYYFSLWLRCKTNNCRAV